MHLAIGNFTEILLFVSCADCDKIITSVIIKKFCSGGFAILFHGLFLWGLRFAMFIVYSVILTSQSDVPTKLQYFADCFGRIVTEDLLEVVKDIVIGGGGIAHNEVYGTHPCYFGNGGFIDIFIKRGN